MKKPFDYSAYKTYALADVKKVDPDSKTTQPPEDAAVRMRRWSEIHRQ
jgi:hypothetical protein